jgi:Fur family ferric uptake transcriptional regulator
MPSTTNSDFWTLPSGMRWTQATRALAQLYQNNPQAAWSEAQVEQALCDAGVRVNRVTVYRLLDRLAQAGLLRKQIDAHRVSRYALADQALEAAPRFECHDCHRQFALAAQGPQVASAMQQVLQALASQGHQGLALDVAVRGRCAGCVEPGGVAAR